MECSVSTRAVSDGSIEPIARRGPIGAGPKGRRCASARQRNPLQHLTMRTRGLGKFPAARIIWELVAGRRGYRTPS